jgi:hypothetical protein
LLAQPCLVGDVEAGGQCRYQGLPRGLVGGLGLGDGELAGLGLPMGLVSRQKALTLAGITIPLDLVRLFGDLAPLAVEQIQQGPILAPVFEAPQHFELGTQVLALSAHPGGAPLPLGQFLQAGMDQAVDVLVLFADAPRHPFQGLPILQSLGGRGTDRRRRVAQCAAGQRGLVGETFDSGQADLRFPGLGGDLRQDGLILKMADLGLARRQVQGGCLLSAQELAIARAGDLANLGVGIPLGQSAQLIQAGEAAVSLEMLGTFALA